MRHHRRLALPAVLTLAALAALTGCSDDDTPDAAEPAVGEGEVEGEQVDTDAFCDSYLAADALAGPAMVGGPDEAAALVAGFDAVSDVPAELAEPVEVVTAFVDASFGGSGEAPSDEDFDEANAAVTSWLIDNCGLDEWAIGASDYEFDTPGALSVGYYAIRLDNAGSELHEAQVVQINPGVELTLEELLELPEEEVLSMITPLTSAVAMPSETGEQIVALTEPGRYAIVCLVPLGSTPEAMEAGEEPATPPHFTEGMFAEVAVGP